MCFGAPLAPAVACRCGAVKDWVDCHGFRSTTRRAFRISPSALFPCLTLELSALFRLRFSCFGLRNPECRNYNRTVGRRSRQNHAQAASPSRISHLTTATANLPPCANPNRDPCHITGSRPIRSKTRSAQGPGWHAAGTRESITRRRASRPPAPRPTSPRSALLAPPRR
eukprot:7386071-Prymnesium_polylepis.2